MENKNKNWWLKLPENFYEKDEIKMIEAMPDGAAYINFYFKILLKSLSNDGNLLFKDTIPYTAEMLASITNTPVATVKYAIDLFRKLGLIEILDSDTLHMSELKKMVGCETKFAEKKREYREKIKSQNEIEDISKTKKGQCPTRDKRLELREKTTTSIIEEVKSENSEDSSSSFGYLDLEEFSRLDKPTKKNILKLNISEAKVRAIFKIVEALEKQGKVKNFNAYLVSSLNENWDIKLKNDENKKDEKKEIVNVTNYILSEAEEYGWTNEKIINEFKERTKNKNEILKKIYLQKLEEHIKKLE